MYADSGWMEKYVEIFLREICCPDRGPIYMLMVVDGGGRRNMLKIVQDKYVCTGGGWMEKYLKIFV